MAKLRGRNITDKERKKIIKEAYEFGIQKGQQKMFDDLIINIDSIRPKIDLVKGINNKQGFVSKQSLFNYLCKKYKIED